MSEGKTQNADIGVDRLLRDGLVLLVPVLVLFGYVLVRPQLLADGDTGWHVATGQWMLSHHQVPKMDIFSYTAPDHPWTAHEWLADVLMGVGYSAAGWWGILLLYALAMAGLGAILAFQTRRWLEPRAATLLIAWTIAGTMPFILARPHVLAWVPLALWTVLLLRARDADRTPPLIAVAVMAIWANLHGSFIFGILLITPFAAEAFFSAPSSRRMEVVRNWTIFVGAALLACLVTPFGISGLLFPFQLMAMPALGSVAEWLPSDFSSLGIFQILLLGGLAASLLLGLRLPAWRMAIVIGMLHMSLSHVRHQAIFAIVTGLIVAAPLARGLGLQGPRFSLRNAVMAHSRDAAKLATVVLFIAIGLAIYRISQSDTRFDSENVPLTALSHVTPEMRQTRAFNEYSFGGSLALAGIPVFIDGRIDMYGEDTLQEYLDIIGSKDVGSWRAAQRRWQIGWTILPPDAPLTAVLDSDPKWHRIYEDRWAVMHAADGIARSMHNDQ